MDMIQTLSILDKGQHTLQIYSNELGIRDNVHLMEIRESQAYSIKIFGNGVMRCSKSFIGLAQRKF